MPARSMVSPEVDVDACRGGLALRGILLVYTGPQK